MLFIYFFDIIKMVCKMKVFNLLFLVLAFLIISGCHGKDIEYYCNVGDELTTDNLCIHESITDPNKKYVCYSGKLVYDKCVSEYTTTASFRRVCPYGYTRGLNGVCTNARGGMVISNYEYYCYSGKLVGTNCVIETTTNANSIDYCDSGYILIDNKCYKETIYPAFER